MFCFVFRLLRFDERRARDFRTLPPGEAPKTRQSSEEIASLSPLGRCCQMSRSKQTPPVCHPPQCRGASLRPPRHPQMSYLGRRRVPTRGMAGPSVGHVFIRGRPTNPSSRLGPTVPTCLWVSPTEQFQNITGVKPAQNP